MEVATFLPMGNRLGNAKGYWKASGEFLKAVRELLENAQIKSISSGQMFLRLGVMKYSGNGAVSRMVTR